MPKLFLLRVGSDSGVAKVHSPIFYDLSYLFVPIPENTKTVARYPGLNGETYSTYSFQGKRIWPFIKNVKGIQGDTLLHDDPEFLAWTYGDPSFSKKRIGEMESGDICMFYASFKEHDGTKYMSNPHALYLFAYFVVEDSRTFTTVHEYNDAKSIFPYNMHVKNKDLFTRDVTYATNNGLKICRGGKRSRVLKKAVKISEKDPPGKSGFHLNALAKSYLGDFGGKTSIQRNALRCVDDKDRYIKTLKWLESLE